MHPSLVVMWQLWPQCQFSPVVLGSKFLHSIHRTFRTLLHVLEMRALAALAALHVILAYPDGECDDVEMLQSSMSHAKETAAIQLSAMVHGGKHRGKPEAEQLVESAQSAEEKSPQSAEEKTAEEKSPQSAEEKEAAELQKKFKPLSFGWHIDGRCTLIQIDDDS